MSRRVATGALYWQGIYKNWHIGLGAVVINVRLAENVRNLKAGHGF